MSTVNNAITPQPPPPEIFGGSRRIWAATWYSILSLFSITLHTTFIAALMYTDLRERTYVMMNDEKVVIRRRGRYFELYWPRGGRVARVIEGGEIAVLLVAVFNTPLIGVRWIDAFMSFVAMTSRNARAFYIINKASNYLVGVVNFAAYALLLFILVKKRMLSLSRNHEIKMTLQVLCMMVAEVLFFLFWELWDMEETDALYFLLAETSILLFYDVLILPYLIFNGFVNTSQ
ncbi:hypothetical protein OSTOST_03996 [Ostertagia ostertagi]